MKSRGRRRPPCYMTWIRLRHLCGCLGRRSGRETRLYQGISLAREWQHYKSFENWCTSHGWRSSMCVVRIDKSKDFSPENCVVVTKAVANGMRACVRRLPDGRSARDIIGRTNLGRDQKYHNQVARRIFEHGLSPADAIKGMVRT